MFIKQQDGRGWNGLIGLRISKKMKVVLSVGDLSLAEILLDSENGLCSMKLISSP